MRTLVGRVSGTVRSSPLRVLVAIAITLGLGGGRATADPRSCASVTADQATKVANLLARGSRYFEYLAGCAQTTCPWKTIDEVAIVGGGSAPRQIRLNGTAVVVGAIYYFGADGNAHNLAMQAGCVVDGYPAKISLTTPAPTDTRRFTLGLRIDISSSEADGSVWDYGGGLGALPDPILRGGLYRDGKQVRALTCRQDNTLVSTCLSGTIIDANEGTSLVLDIKEWDDGSDNDAIGALSVSLREAIRNGGRSVNVRASGRQIKSVTLSLTPVE